MFSNLGLNKIQSKDSNYRIQKALFVLFFITIYIKENFNSAALILLTSYMIISQWKSVKQIKISKYNILFFILFLLSLLSILYSVNIQMAFKVLIRYLPLILFPIIVSLISKKILREIISYFILITVGATVICLIYALYRYVDIGNWKLMNEYGLYYSIFSGHEFSKVLGIHASYFSVNILISIGFLYEKFNQVSQINLKEKRNYILLILYLSICVYLLNSFAILMALLIVAMLILAMRLKRHRTAILVLLCLGGSIMFYTKFKKRLNIDSFSIPIETTAREGKWNNFNTRVAKWSGALGVINENPVLGVGIGDSKDELMKSYLDNGFNFGYESKFNEHNQFFGVWMQSGILALLTYIIIVLSPIIIGFKNKHIPMITFGITYAFFSIGESFLIRQRGIVVFALFYVIIFSFYKYKDKC